MSEASYLPPLPALSPSRVPPLHLSRATSTPTQPLACGAGALLPTPLSSRTAGPHSGSDGNCHCQPLTDIFGLGTRGGQALGHYVRFSPPLHHPLVHLIAWSDPSLSPWFRQAGRVSRIAPILQMRKVRSREVKLIAQISRGRTGVRLREIYSLPLLPGDRCAAGGTYCVPSTGRPSKGVTFDDAGLWSSASLPRWR